jgi:hypothetical protein
MPLFVQPHVRHYTEAPRCGHEEVSAHLSHGQRLRPAQLAGAFHPPRLGQRGRIA